jgi:phage terminase Nu1 subunit (DNA packaging protein)
MRAAGLPLVTRPQLAAAFGVHAVTISKWEAHDGLPVEQPGAPGKPSRYSLPAAIAWRLERERAKYATEAGALNLDDERARLAKVQARRVDLDVRRREGELVPWADVTGPLTEILGAIRAHLLALPAALAPLLATAVQTGGPRAGEAVLREHITAALRELVAWRPPAGTT